MVLHQNKEVSFRDFGTRDDEGDSDAKISNTFKDAVSFFIIENKRLPNKVEMKEINEKHLPKLEIETLWDFTEEGLKKVLGKLSPLEWKQEYEQEWVMDNGDVVDSGAIAIDNAGTTEFKNVDFTTYITTDAASESALGSTKGINKYTLDHPGI